MNIFTRRLRSCAAGGATVLALAVSCSAYAVDDLGIFELEGNAVDDNGFATSPDDWQTLFDNGGHATTTTDPKPGGNVVIEDPAPGSIFTQGGSKDPNFIIQWRHKDGSVPDKDDITNAYAANYLTAGGDQIIYFGADRYANDGDAVMGFWFFQDSVAPVNGGTFVGEHMNGDVFVIANFQGGGQIVTVEVMEWDTTCAKASGSGPQPAGACAAANLRVRLAAGAAKCGTTAGDLACAITNPTGTETSPWTYTPKQGTANTFPVASFFEGGVNISQLFGGRRCFSSFLAETRSSSSETAVLKDFVLGAFDVCKVEATKKCTNDSTADDVLGAITFNVRGCAINSGAAPVKFTALGNVIGSDPSVVPADLKWYEPTSSFDPAAACGNPVALATEIAAGTEVNPATTSVDPGEALIYQFSETTASTQPTDTVTVSATGIDGTTVKTASASATCPQRLFNAGLSITKRCAADLEAKNSNLVVKIGVQGQVCNQGEVQLTGLTLVDDPAMPTGVSVTLTPQSTTLAAKGKTGECTSYTGSYYPSTMPQGNACPFPDQVVATASAPVGTNANSPGCKEESPGVITCKAVSNTATCNLRALDGDNNCATGPLSPAP